MGLAGATNRAGSVVMDVTTYLTLCGGIYLFKRYLININWRFTQMWTVFVMAGMNLMWLIPILLRGSVARNPWLCVGIDCSEQFIQGITQVMLSMAVIELAPPGLEATT